MGTPLTGTLNPSGKKWMEDMSKLNNVSLKPYLASPTPLNMPVQQAGNRNSRGRVDLPSLPLSVICWRIVMVALTLSITGFFAYEFYSVLALNGITNTQIVLLILSVASFLWIAIGASTSICGFFAKVTGIQKGSIKVADMPERLNSQTALLFPVYNEDPDRIAATITAIALDLRATGHEESFDFFILSDSAKEDAREREHDVYQALSQSLRQVCSVYYRWRQNNEGKKAGNIANWVKNQGGGYDHFVIFDADSIMSAETLVRLAATMERNPRAGLVQTVPMLIGGSSVMAGIQQFAGRLYGPLLASGSALWHGRDSNYWGHNAIIRTRAFASSAGLPELTGREPFGGTIQSHDFVEAAFLRRKGWDVHLAPDLGGSYEGCPATIVDLIVRDRRWCQGNLQHARLVAWPGLTLVSRFHLISGIAAYVASLIWLLALGAGLVTALQSKDHEHKYFGDQVTLFPDWPIMDSERAYTLMLFTLAVLLLPKILGFIYGFICDRAWSRAGIQFAMIPGFIAEIVLSAFVAPIFMIAHVRGVISVLMGRSSGWASQSREGASLSMSDAIRLFGMHSVLGLALAYTCHWVSAELAAWLALVYTGLIFAPFAAWGSAKRFGGPLSRLLRTPEDVVPHRVVQIAETIYAERKTETTPAIVPYVTGIGHVAAKPHREG